MIPSAITTSSHQLSKDWSALEDSHALDVMGEKAALVEEIFGPRLPVPQLSQKTGISADYANVYNGLVMILCGLDEWREIPEDSQPVRFLQRYPPCLYEERFKDYEIVITEQNKQAIARLNAIAREMNDLVRNSTIVSMELISMLKIQCNEVYQLIYGDNRIMFPGVRCDTGRV